MMIINKQFKKQFKSKASVCAQFKSQSHKPVVCSQSELKTYFNSCLQRSTFTSYSI